MARWLSQAETAPPEIAYSEFLTQLADGDITDVTIEDGHITGTRSGGEEFATYAPPEAASDLAGQLSERGIGQSTCIGIGGDPVVGTTFIDALELFNGDPDTDAIILIASSCVIVAAGGGGAPGAGAARVACNAFMVARYISIARLSTPNAAGAASFAFFELGAGSVRVFFAPFAPRLSAPSASPAAAAASFRLFLFVLRASRRAELYARNASLHVCLSPSKSAMGWKLEHLWQKRTSAPFLTTWRAPMCSRHV